MAFALLAPLSAIAETGRGLEIRLKASEKKNAPYSGTMQLYGDSHALVIGIDRYVGGWPRLKNAVSDARAVAAALKNQGFNVTLKTDLKSDELSKILKEFFAIKGADPEARLFFWYAGHGHTINNEGYLVPADAPADTSPAFKVAALPMRDFGSLMRLSESKHVLSVFDSCFSGTIFQARSGAAPKAITQKTSRPVRQFITAGDAGQYVRDDGSFREYFIRAITGDEDSDFNNDGYVTGEELGLFLNQQITSLTTAAQTPQVGKLHDVRFNQGDFVFALPEEKSSAHLQSVPAQFNPEVVFWQSIQNSKTGEDYCAYLSTYKDGSFAALAKARAKQFYGTCLTGEKKQTASLSPSIPVERPPAIPSNSTFQSLNQTMYTAKNSRVRETPSGKQISTLLAGNKTKVIGKTEHRGEDWYKVRLQNGTEGFIYGSLLTESYQAPRSNDRQEIGRVTETYPKYGYLVFRDMTGRANGMSKIYAQISAGNVVELSIEKRVGNLVSAIPKKGMDGIRVGTKIVK
ncbi:caspase family protein [Magnetovibrio sp. PR-2]|uniref:caspase family protein n=1 Tax=Magnetovibrio sp. PR-2 TaxID=3120356 RepID=UPI002FCDF006